MKNDLTRNAIESVVWNLGGTDNYESSSNGLASHWYGYERGTTVYTDRPTTWTGKIGLMYPSDYGYATAGGTTTNRDSCLAQELYNWSVLDKPDCKNNDYLFKFSYAQWTLAPYSFIDDRVFYVSSSGAVYDIYAYNLDLFGTYGVRPAAYLKSSISLSSVGDGSSTSPYQLKVG